MALKNEFELENSIGKQVMLVICILNEKQIAIQLTMFITLPRSFDLNLNC